MNSVQKSVFNDNQVQCNDNSLQTDFLFILYKTFSNIIYYDMTLNFLILMPTHGFLQISCFHPDFKN